MVLIISCKNSKKPRGRPFEKGRPRGCRNRSTQAAQQLQGEAEALTRKAVELARAVTRPRCGSVSIG
jgi:hypothetical protein